MKLAMIAAVALFALPKSCEVYDQPRIAGPFWKEETIGDRTYTIRHNTTYNRWEVWLWNDNLRHCKDPDDCREIARELYERTR